MILRIISSDEGRSVARPSATRGGDGNKLKKSSPPQTWASGRRLRSVWPKANEMIQWTLSSDEGRSVAQPSATRGGDGNKKKIMSAVA
jgi:hypothetical protein